MFVALVLYVFLCRSLCLFLYGPFCHGALKAAVLQNILKSLVTIFSKYLFK